MNTSIITERNKDVQQPPKFRTAYGDKLRVVAPVIGDSKTKQQFREQSDINYILRDYEKTGVFRNVNVNEPQYGFVPAIDFHEAMQVVTLAQDNFARVPSEIRERFANDPGQFIEFVQNPDNADELRKLGLMRPLDDPEPSQPAQQAYQAQAQQTSTEPSEDGSGE